MIVLYLLAGYFNITSCQKVKSRYLRREASCQKNISNIFPLRNTSLHNTRTVKVSFNGFSPQKYLCHFEPNLQTALSSFPYLYLRKSDFLLQASMFSTRFKHILCLLNLYFWIRRRRSILPLIYLRSFVNMSTGVEEFSGKRKYVNASCGARKKYVNASCGAHLIFVTDTTDGVCVKKITRCKFLKI